MAQFGTGGQMLESLGFTPEEERAYEVILRRAGESPAEVAGALGVSTRQARDLLVALERRGLVSRAASRLVRYVPAAPGAALEVLILRRQEELERARLAESHFEEMFRTAGQGSNTQELVEVIRGPETISQRFQQLVLSAKRELISFSRPPFVNTIEQTLSFKLDFLRTGITTRGVYDITCLETPGYVDFIEQCAVAGEEIRTVSNLPVKFIIVDRQMALIPLRTEQGDIDLLVHASSLMDTLLAMFDMVWERALPFTPHLPAGSTSRDGTDISIEDRRVLAMLAAGLRDDAIGRQLGVGSHTAERRVSRLLDLLGARTRFQAALLASRRGWFGGDVLDGRVAPVKRRGTI